MPGEFPVCLKISSALAEQVLRVPIQSPLFDQIPGTASVRARLCSSGQATAEQGNCILGGTAAGLIVVLLVGSGERIENKPELPLGRDAKGCFFAAEAQLSRGRVALGETLQSGCHLYSCSVTN